MITCGCGQVPANHPHWLVPRYIRCTFVRWTPLRPAMSEGGRAGTSPPLFSRSIPPHLVPTGSAAGPALILASLQIGFLQALLAPSLYFLLSPCHLRPLELDPLSQHPRCHAQTRTVGRVRRRIHLPAYRSTRSALYIGFLSALTTCPSNQSINAQDSPPSE
ncbi:hypothetical protein HD806DRAFT_237806 [Xylariaceae sp. AK1471]|nr:hypothetical protein HD806DRAFT_237806 [Xylariaceae sp. AK1471]